VKKNAEQFSAIFGDNLSSLTSKKQCSALSQNRPQFCLTQAERYLFRRVCFACRNFFLLQWN